MKIVIATSRPFHLIHLARELANNGHEVSVFGYMPQARIHLYKPGKAKYSSLFLNLLPDTAFALQRGLRRLQHAATERLLSSVDKFVAQRMPECDVFIGLSGVAVESLKIAKERYGALTICDRGSSHVLTQQKALADRQASRLSDYYVERELVGYAAADFVTVPSLYAERSFIENGFDTGRLFVNNYGVDLARFQSIGRLKQNGQTCQALFVGGWSYQKGCDVIASAIEIDSNLYVTHIGSKGDLEFPRSAQFQALGHIRNDKLAEYYSSHDVLMLPSRQDGFGMVLLEAMACGIPIVASHNTGAPDIKKIVSNPDSVTLMEDVSPGALLGAIRYFKEHQATDSSELLSDSEKSYFTWSEYGRRYSEFVISVRKGGWQ